MLIKRTKEERRTGKNHTSIIGPSPVGGRRGGGIRVSRLRSDRRHGLDVARGSGQASVRAAVSGWKAVRVLQAPQELVQKLRVVIQGGGGKLFVIEKLRRPDRQLGDAITVVVVEVAVLVPDLGGVRHVLDVEAIVGGKVNAENVRERGCGVRMTFVVD